MSERAAAIGRESSDRAGRLSVPTYLLTLLLASIFATIWTATGPEDAVVSALIIWIIPAALVRNLKQGSWAYYLCPLIAWGAILALWLAGAN